jgi:hypothetical protein
MVQSSTPRVARGIKYDTTSNLGKDSDRMYFLNRHLPGSDGRLENK